MGDMQGNTSQHPIISCSECQIKPVSRLIVSSLVQRVVSLVEEDALLYPLAEKRSHNVEGQHEEAGSVDHVHPAEPQGKSILGM